jgi:hypothetical protein
MEIFPTRENNFEFYFTKKMKIRPEWSGLDTLGVNHLYECEYRWRFREVLGRKFE